MINWRRSRHRDRTGAAPSAASPAPGVGEADDRLRVLVITPFYLPAWRGGGPIRSLSAMIEAHGDRHDFSVLTSAYDWGESAPMPLPSQARRGDWVPVGKARVRYVPAFGASALRSRKARKRLAEAWRSALDLHPDVTYLTGVFPALWSIAPLTLRRLGRLPLGRVVIAPRGEFSPGALALKWGKKRVFIANARALGLFRGVTWHASTELEAAEVRAMVPDAHVIVRENETTLPTHARRGPVELPAAPAPAPDDPALEAEESASGEASSRESGEATGHRPLRVLYLGRLSPKKGVDVLLRALRYVTSDVDVTIVGSAADEHYLARLREMRRGLRHSVTFAAAVEPDGVSQMFRSHDVFVFPTAGENFGHTIVESLCDGCPVMVTAHATPWTDRAAAGGGGAVDGRDPAAWAGAIDQFAAAGPDAWARRREAAADAYDAWRASQPQESVFDLLG